MPEFNNVPRAVQRCHELLAWLIPLLDHFPRSRRFTLGERLESGLLVSSTLVPRISILGRCSSFLVPVFSPLSRPLPSL